MRRPGRRPHVVGRQPAILAAARPRLPRPPQVSVEHPRRRTARASPPDEQADGHPLLDVEYVLVLAPVRRAFLLLRIAVQVQQVNLVEALHQALAHPAEGRVVEIAVVGDEAQHALARALDPPLGEAEELDVIVVQPFRVPFAERFAVHPEIAAGLVGAVPASQQPGDPCAPVGGVPGIGWVAEHHHHRLLALHGVRPRRFAGDLTREQRPRTLLVRLLQRVGEEDPESPALRHGEPGLRSADLQRQLQVADGVGRHQQLEPGEARQQVIAHVVAPCAAEPLRLDRRPDTRHDLPKKAPGPRRRIEDQHARAG